MMKNENKLIKIIEENYIFWVGARTGDIIIMHTASLSGPPRPPPVLMVFNNNYPIPLHFLQKTIIPNTYKKILVE